MQYLHPAHNIGPNPLVPYRSSPSYLGPLPDDVLDFAGFVAQLFVAKGLHSGRKGFILEERFLLQILLSEDVKVLATKSDGFAQRSFSISSLSLPD